MIKNKNGKQKHDIMLSFHSQQLLQVIIKQQQFLQVIIIKNDVNDVGIVCQKACKQGRDGHNKIFCETIPTSLFE